MSKPLPEEKRDARRVARLQEEVLGLQEELSALYDGTGGRDGFRGTEASDRLLGLRSKELRLEDIGRELERLAGGKGAAALTSAQLLAAVRMELEHLEGLRKALRRHQGARDTVGAASELAGLQRFRSAVVDMRGARPDRCDSAPGRALDCNR